MKGALLNLALVGLGGAIGAMARFGLGGAVQRVFGSAAFPWGTLAVNVVGCLLVGLLAGMAEAKQVVSVEWRVFLFVGVLGGFTTYSAFGYETFQLARNEDLLRATGNIALHLVAGLGAVWLGYGMTAAR